MQQTARQGDKVSVHYKGTLDDGSVFDSSEGSDPIEFTVGAREVIEGFDDAIVGMAVGDRKTENIPAERAYGEREDDLVFNVPRASMQPGFDVAVGDVVRVQLPDGHDAPMQIAALDDQTITLDANHPLAGKALTFELELVGIR
jgi:peptidylprolyl isomerase